MTPPGALPSPRARLAGVVPGVPHVPAGHRDRQVKCRDLARFGPMHSPMSGRKPPARPPASRSAGPPGARTLAAVPDAGRTPPGPHPPGRYRPHARPGPPPATDPKVIMVRGGTSPVARKLVMKGRSWFSPIVMRPGGGLPPGWGTCGASQGQTCSGGAGKVAAIVQSGVLESGISSSPGQAPVISSRVAPQVRKVLTVIAARGPTEQIRIAAKAVARDSHSYADPVDPETLGGRAHRARST